MEKLIDRLIILVCCSIFLLSAEIDLYTVVPLILTISLVSVNIAYDLAVTHIGTNLFFMLLIFVCPDLIYFVPLMNYDLYREPYKYVSLLSLFVVFANRDCVSMMLMIWIVVLCTMSFLMKSKTIRLLETRKEAYFIRDDLVLKQEKLREKNKELLECQDYEIQNAMLSERNRIAREIHDNVGHLISSSLIQIGALLAITKDETQKEYLEQIKQTLSDGMTSIRESIHNIHEESMDLELKIKELIKNFEYCRVTLDYRVITDLPMKAKYSLIYIIKESMTNMVKHSDADLMEITFLELPAFYKIIIENNGKLIDGRKSESTGMGIAGMIERVNNLGGNINITDNNGYKILITLPK